MGIYGGMQMNKIRVIDLLNKIANGEKVPEKIEYRNKIFIYDKDNQCYIVENYNEYDDLHMSLSNHKGTDLNYEVEIIEEDKKIEKIDLSEWAEITYNEDWKLLAYDFNRNSNLFVDKINEIIDYINKEK